MLILRATQKLLQRIGPPALQDGEQSIMLLGEWYATALFSKPQVALLVNETTLLPVLIPLAPAATLPARIAQQIATALATHGAPSAIIDDELHSTPICSTSRQVWPQRRVAPCTARGNSRTNRDRRVGLRFAGAAVTDRYERWPGRYDTDSSQFAGPFTVGVWIFSWSEVAAFSCQGRSGRPRLTQKPVAPSAPPLHRDGHDRPRLPPRGL
ncbi:DUF6933 domain-containing protein [Planosporangium mesophilum]|uniref:DUF6933 domain-containing protein n=1 Tax=Planosporangium mesophilum TaxID=689768 RepID=A0A8J3X3G9_9ACTN|nr:hypothetical protein [Planosporangium mesophilum]GII22848.1 hypothetical protein Pme01_24450 [Planosporangium mesophilum]